MEKPKVLTAKELRTPIMLRLSGWKLAQNNSLESFKTSSITQRREQSWSPIFETVDHHPDVRIAYGEVTFELTRYDLGGKVTNRDVEGAKKISSASRWKPKGDFLVINVGSACFAW
jgi:pterin-4a-carbinolamine dehydratase